jgi:uncharacterized protein (TIGR02466 family)
MLPFVIQDSDTNQAVKQKMNIKGFFPIPVGFSQIDEAVNKKFMEFIKIKQLKFIKYPNGNSVSSDVYILDNDELSDIKKVLTDSVNEYFKEMVNSDKDMELYITTSCINVTKNGESHRAHKHANSVVSTVLYIDTCEGDTLSFINPNINVFGNLTFSVDHTPWNTTEWNIPAMVNTLVMFPSTLPHMVMPRPNICTGTRISLAFNTWIRGRIGGEDSVDQLHL